MLSQVAVKVRRQPFYKAMNSHKEVAGTLCASYLQKQVNVDTVLRRTKAQIAVDLIRQFGDESVLVFSEHPATLQSVHNIASLLAAQERLDEAERLAREAVDGRRVVLGADHPKTLESVELLETITRERASRESPLPEG